MVMVLMKVMVVVLVLMKVMVIVVMIMVAVMVMVVMIMVVMNMTSNILSLKTPAVCQIWCWALLQPLLSLPVPPAGTRSTVALCISESVFISSEHLVPPHSPGYLWLCNGYSKPSGF